MRSGFKWLIALLVLTLFAMMVLPVLWSIVFGGGFDASASDRITQSNDNNVATAGDIAVGAGDTFAFAHGLGDVDINQCLASTQWGTIIVSKQKVVLNKWCAAEVYDSKGLYEMAAKVRCDIDEIAKFFPDDNAACVIANTMKPRQDNQLTDIIENQQAMLVAVEEDHDEELRGLEARLEAVEAKPAQVVRRQPVTQYGITDDQREQLAEVFKE